jgi:hypothetical protein
MGRYDDDEDISTVATKERKRTEEPFPDNDERPARRVVRRGWGEASRTRDSDSPYAQRLKYGQSPILIKFLEDEPFAAFHQHWIDRQGQRSFVCLGDDCPLCEAGNRASAQFCFNVLEITPGDEPRIRSFQFGPRVFDQVRNFHTDPRQGPISKHYWAISKSGEKSTSSTNFQMVRERDILDEWGIKPLTDDDINDLRRDAYTEEIIQIPTRKQLLEIAAEDL